MIFFRIILFQKYLGTEVDLNLLPFQAQPGFSWFLKVISTVPGGLEQNNVCYLRTYSSKILKSHLLPWLHACSDREISMPYSMPALPLPWLHALLHAPCSHTLLPCLTPMPCSHALLPQCLAWLGAEPLLRALQFESSNGHVFFQ